MGIANPYYGGNFDRDDWERCSKCGDILHSKNYDNSDVLCDKCYFQKTDRKTIEKSDSTKTYPKNFKIPISVSELDALQVEIEKYKNENIKLKNKISLSKIHTEEDKDKIFRLEKTIKLYQESLEKYKLEINNLKNQISLFDERSRKDKNEIFELEKLVEGYNVEIADYKKSKIIQFFIKRVLNKKK